MKKISLIVIGVAILAGAGAFVLMKLAAQTVTSRNGEVSERVSNELQAKIDAIKKAETEGDSRKPVDIEVSETEMESYVLYSLRQDIPVQMDSFDVQLSPGAVAAETQMTFNSMNTGNPIVDTLVTGTHNLFVKGQFIGEAGRGKFELEEVRIDGIPVPKVLIETLFKKYVKPKYPDADLKESFDLPWGIDQITIEQGKAKIRY